MESLYLLIPLSLVLAFVIGGIFWWATRNGQFDDMEGPAHRILMDDDKPRTATPTRAATETPASRSPRAPALLPPHPN